MEAQRQYLEPIEPTKDKEVGEIGSRALQLLGEAEILTIQGSFEVEYGTALLTDIAKIKKGAEEKRTYWVKPLNEGVKRINDFFKQLLSPIEKADKILRTKILTYRQEEQRRAREIEERLRKEAEEAQVKAEEEAKAKGVPAPPPPVMEVPKVQTSSRTTKVEGSGSATARKTWDAEIENAGIIPESNLRGLIETDYGRAALDRFVKGLVKAGIRSIPGVRIFEKEILSVKG